MFAKPIYSALVASRARARPVTLNTTDRPSIPSSKYSHAKSSLLISWWIFFFPFFFYFILDTPQGPRLLLLDSLRTKRQARGISEDDTRTWTKTDNRIMYIPMALTDWLTLLSLFYTHKYARRRHTQKKRRERERGRQKNGWGWAGAYEVYLISLRLSSL